MLHSLAIKNYRNLRNLEIPKLGRINLIIGKNNTGKTAFLEAISIYINKGNYAYLLSLLEERGENYIRKNSDSFKLLDVIRTFGSLFYGRDPYSNENIIIGEIENTLFGYQAKGDLSISIKIVKYVEDYEDVVDTPVRRRKEIIDINDNNPDAKLGVEIKGNLFNTIIPISNVERFYRVGSQVINDDISNYQFIRTKNIDRDVNANLWDKITLTENEEDVISSLKLIEPLIERLSFINKYGRSQERVPVVKLKGTGDVIPLKSMGDGINRILTIILAMVNCEEGFILIDEFENGLHYSVQEKLWEIVFHLAEKLNIQVFATTHSRDTIEAFSYVLSNNTSNVGYMLRLDNYKGIIEPVLYDAKEVLNTTTVDIDPR